MNFTTYSEISIIAKFLEILVDIGRNHKAFHQQNGDRDIHHQKEYMEKFLFITDYISNHFSENLTLEEVASLAASVNITLPAFLNNILIPPSTNF